MFVTSRKQPLPDVYYSCRDEELTAQQGHDLVKVAQWDGARTGSEIFKL